MKDFKELFCDAQTKRIRTLLNSRGVEVDKQKEVSIDLDEKLIRHLATAENCRGLALFTRTPDAKVDFFSRERPKMGAELVITAGDLRAPGPVEKPVPPKPPGQR